MRTGGDFDFDKNEKLSFASFVKRCLSSAHHFGKFENGLLMVHSCFEPFAILVSLKGVLVDAIQYVRCHLSPIIQVGTYDAAWWV